MADPKKKSTKKTKTRLGARATREDATRTTRRRSKGSESPKGRASASGVGASNRGSQSDISALAAAESYLNAGFSIVPVRSDGSKAPAVEWKGYQEESADRGKLKEWFVDSDLGVGIVGGKVSDGLTVLDFDDPEAFAAWRTALETIDSGLLSRLPIVQTPSGGAHVYYRSSKPLKNLKLAMRLKGQSDRKTLIETRGEGGYCLAPGSPPSCHPSGCSYRLISEIPITETPTLASDEAALLIGLARSLDEKPQEYRPPARAAAENAKNRPGDQFNRRTDWSSILEPHGWGSVRTIGEVTYWRRPDKNRGISATTGYCTSEDAGHLLHVFSTNADPFDMGHSYSKFAAHTLLNFDGNFKKAAAETAREVRSADKTKADPEELSIKPIRLKDCFPVYERWLCDIDRDAIEIVLGVFAANHLPGDPSWLFLVGPPSKGKTEILRPVYDHPQGYALSSLTENTLVSGYVSESGEQDDPSLLPELNGKVVIIKDFTTILDLGADKQRELFGQLRDIYDGQTAKAYGNGVRRNYTATFGLIAAVTNAIEERQKTLQPLGERFLRYRPKDGDDRARTRKAIANANDKPKMREELAKAAAGAIKNAVSAPPRIPDEIRDRVIDLATLLAGGRTRVAKDAGHNLISVPEKEGGARVAQQLLRIALGVGMLNRRINLTHHELRICAKIVAHSLPSTRYRVLRALASKSGSLQIESVVKLTGIPKSTVYKTLQELLLLNLVRHAKTRRRKPKLASKVQLFRIVKEHRETVDLIVRSCEDSVE